MSGESDEDDSLSSDKCEEESKEELASEQEQEQEGYQEEREGEEEQEGADKEGVGEQDGEEEQGDADKEGVEGQWEGREEQECAGREGEEGQWEGGGGREGAEGRAGECVRGKEEQGGVGSDAGLTEGGTAVSSQAEVDAKGHTMDHKVSAYGPVTLTSSDALHQCHHVFRGGTTTISTARPDDEGVLRCFELMDLILLPCRDTL